MNAYELADAIEDWDSDGQWDTPAANMLRQQADRIAELEKQGKPVAWMFQGAFDISTYVSFEKPNPDIYPNPTPLYTAPQTKPLSDEEIEAVLTPFVTAQFELNKTPPKFDYLGFVRAIEERHGIK